MLIAHCIKNVHSIRFSVERAKGVPEIRHKKAEVLTVLVSVISVHQSGAEPGQPSTRIFHTVSTRRRHTTTQTLISAPARFLIKDTSHPPQIQMDVDGYWLWMDL